MIQLYANSLHGHLTTIQMQSINFTHTQKIIMPGNPDILKPLWIMNYTLCNMSILYGILTCVYGVFWIILRPLNGVENAYRVFLKWNFFGKKWDESLLKSCLYTLMLILLDAGFVDSYWISDAFGSKQCNILHFAQILTSITIGNFAS